MEELYAELLLWGAGFDSGERYNVLLDIKFMGEPDNDILLELECLSSNLLDGLGRFMRYWEYECSQFSSDLFGARLFSGLKEIYDANTFKISDFGTQCYKLWQMLPRSVNQLDPFFALCYADDPLSWGDEKQTRDIYESAFSFYDE